MPVQVKPFRSQFREVPAAAVKLEDLAAGPAMEVVMVVFGDFVPRGLSRDGDRRDLARFDEQLECPVHRREAQRVQPLRRERKNLSGRDGRAGLSNDIPDRRALAGSTLCGWSRVGGLGRQSLMISPGIMGQVDRSFCRCVPRVRPCS